jgi:hypothetical protein
MSASASALPSVIGSKPSTVSVLVGSAISTNASANPTAALSTADGSTSDLKSTVRLSPSLVTVATPRSSVASSSSSKNSALVPTLVTVKLRLPANPNVAFS